MTFNIITIFPEIFSSYFNESIIKRAQEAEKIKINIINLRDFTHDKHKTVDDTPYGGGAGMVVKVDVLYRALRKNELRIMNNELCEDELCEKGVKKDPLFMIHNSKTVLLSAKGKKWTQAKAREYSDLENITLICGRYEGVDERILEYVDEEISIGDYVLTGGEIGAMAVLDSITRLVPGVLGNSASSADESHTVPGELEYPQYTRPEVFVDDKGRELKVPDVLLSGNHAEIEKWRRGRKKLEGRSWKV
jgi:tRNA (guanine37-N1)-methyltransferase